MSLRLRLLLAVVGLVAVGLLVADGLTYLSLQSFLVQRVDQQLEAAPLPVLHALESSSSGLPGNVPTVPTGESAVLPPGTYGCLLNDSGQVLAQVSYGGSSPPVPALPADLAQTATGNGGQATLTVPAAGRSSLRFRLLATQYGGSPYTLVAAIPLTEVTQTLQRLLLVEGIVTFTVLRGLGLLAWWIVRRELRPLDDMAATAGAIAAGDLTRRFERADAGTEVGRLGLALNTMLAQIEEALTKSRSSENALRRFLAQASHELRTPLSSIRGYAELFRRGARERPEDLALAMRRIEEEAARMGLLVEELLLLARLDEGRALDREPVDLTRLTNLVVNALRHAGDGARVRVRTSVADGRAVLEVSDDGVGMPNDVAGRVFEPFYRSSEARGRGEGTAGLGLSIVAAIAAAPGGDVELQTAPGQGARFRVRVPLAVGPEGSAAPAGDDDADRAAAGGGEEPADNEVPTAGEKPTATTQTDGAAER